MAQGWLPHHHDESEFGPIVCQLKILSLYHIRDPVSGQVWDKNTISWHELISLKLDARRLDIP